MFGGCAVKRGPFCLWRERHKGARQRVAVNPHPVFVGDVKDKKKNRYEMVDD